MDVLNPAPLIKPIEGLAEAIRATLGAYVVEIVDAHFELSVTVVRDDLARAMELLRDRLAYQQLMEIAGVDYPDRAERFEVCYHLLSVTKNHRLRVKVQADESNAVPSVTHLWPVAGWLEREVFDMYGVLFSGNADLRRILTDYGFKGYPFRKDFPLTGYVEMRYSEELKRVVYEPVRLAQDFRSFDFMSPWEGADYILPGDEKAPAPPSPPPPAPPSPPVATPKTTDKPADTGAGEPANTEAAKPSRVRKSAAAKGEAAVAKPKATRTRKPKAPTKAEGGDA